MAQEVELRRFRRSLEKVMSTPRTFVSMTLARRVEPYEEHTLALRGGSGSSCSRLEQAVTAEATGSAPAIGPGGRGSSSPGDRSAWLLCDPTTCSPATPRGDLVYAARSRMSATSIRRSRCLTLAARSRSADRGHPADDGERDHSYR